MRRSAIALLSISVIGASPLAAQRQTDQNAFTWSGRVPSGHWIRVRNLSGEINVVASNSDRVEVTATRQWRRSDQRDAKRLDRAADRDDDADLNAYNAMLAELAKREQQVHRRGQLGLRASAALYDYLQSRDALRHMT